MQCKHNILRLVIFLLFNIRLIILTAIQNCAVTEFSQILFILEICL